MTLCEHSATTWAEAPIGRELLTRLVEAGDLESPCTDCPDEMETR